MFKCTKDPENKKWHKSNVEAIACGCLLPKQKKETKTTAKIEKAIEKIVKPDNDKTTGEPPLNEAVSTMSASPVVSEKPEQEQQPEQEKKKSWILEICIAIAAILLAAFWIFHYFLMPPKQDEEKENE